MDHHELCLTRKGMGSLAWRAKIRSAVLGMMMISLQACSINSAPVIERTGTGIARTSTVTLVGASETQTQSQFRAALERHFSSYGIAQTEAGSFVVDYSISARPAEIGLARDDADGKAAGEIDYVSIPRDNQFLQKCGPQRLRATLVIFDRASGALSYRGIREINLCDVSVTSIEEMAAALVKDAQHR
ncbi:hypothetical protein [Pontixanthobacter sp.]|uniref:hypothetical protein n=1 Tax=Pontixanthobacter sp. TaxID=2792078 RepID=UPI003C7A112A